MSPKPSYKLALWPQGKSPKWMLYFLTDDKELAERVALAIAKIAEGDAQQSKDRRSRNE